MCVCKKYTQAESYGGLCHKDAINRCLRNLFVHNNRKGNVDGRFGFYK